MRIAALILVPAVAASSSHPVQRPLPEQASHRAAPDVERPLRWLVAAQNADGSWGDGARSSEPDVATTALAGIALLRLGHSGSRGEHRQSTLRAVGYVISAVERTPAADIA